METRRQDISRNGATELERFMDVSLTNQFGNKTFERTGRQRPASLSAKRPVTIRAVYPRIGAGEAPASSYFGPF